MENAVLENIQRRRSVRKYLPEQISDQELSLILEAGRFAPSGSNHQTTHFLVLQNAEILRDLQKVVEQEFAGMDLAANAYSSMKASVEQSKKGGYEFFYRAPTLVVVANRKGYGNAMADCSTALENMMLAAASLKIGSCWINQLRWLNEDEAVVAFLEKLGLGKDEIVCGSLSLGYSDQKELPPLGRKGNPVTYVR